MNMPTLDEVLGELEELSGRPVDPKLNVADLGIDSLVLAEWVYGLEERLGAAMDDEKIQELLDLPLEGIYRRMVTEAGQQPV